MISPQMVVAFAFGLAFIVALIVLAVKFPHPTPFQHNIFRSIFALAGAGIAAMLPGFLNVDLSGTGILIRAGGALAVFVVLFFFNPARLKPHEAGLESPPEPRTLSNGQPFPPEMRQTFSGVWRALVALDRAGEALWQRVSGPNLIAFADRKHEADALIDDAALFFSDGDYNNLRDLLQAADFYLNGKMRLSNIRDDKVITNDYELDLSDAINRDRFVDGQVRSQIEQNRHWLTRYRDLLTHIRSSFHKAVTGHLDAVGAA